VSPYARAGRTIELAQTTSQTTFARRQPDVDYTTRTDFVEDINTGLVGSSPPSGPHKTIGKIDFHFTRSTSALALTGDRGVRNPL